MRLDTLKFAISGGIIGGFSFGWTTLAALLNVPGFMPFAKLLEQGYSFYGYSISWAGFLIGAFWGFTEGFIWLGLLAVIYNRLMKSTKL